MSNDYIPRSDADYNIWQSNLMTLVKTNLAPWGISTDDFKSLEDKQAVWNSAFAKASNKQNRTSADVQAKDDARDDFKPAIRAFVAQWLASNNLISNSDRERMGLTVRSDSRTPTPVPSTSPMGTIDFSVRLQHNIHFFDSTTPKTKAKPAGVHACEIWTKTGDAADFTYLVSDTRTSHIVSFDQDSAGKTIYYRLRWINTRGEQGPWSSVISAIVMN
jgi:hypothetical protein